MLAPKVTSPLKPTTKPKGDEQSKDVIATPSDNSVIFNLNQHPRISTASDLTVNTVTSSNARNTTNNTAATDTMTSGSCPAREGF
jgi:hypothetical protein